MKLHWQILIALGAAALAGALLGDVEAFIRVCDMVGTIFLNALKMLIVPLIVSAMVCAMLGIGSGDALGRLGWRTALYFIATTLVSVLTALVIINLLQPGIIDGQPAGERLGLSAETGAVLERVEGRGGSDIADIFVRIVPANLFDAAVNGDMLGLIFFAILFGYFTARLPGALGAVQQQFWQGLYEVMIAITGLIMRLAPLGVFALVTETVAQTGWGALKPLAYFFFAVVLGLGLQIALWLPLLLRAFGLSPRAHYRATLPALLTAFSTSSSAATLPVTFDRLQNHAGVSPQVAGFVLPLGATVNMNGTALYECAAALFIAQAYGLELSFVTQFTVVVLALLTSIGVAGIPSASLVAIAVILTAIGLPLEGVGLILAVDRVLDMCRTAVNVFGDTVGAVLIARLQGEPVLNHRPPTPP
ncbi:dicarboxylate/amino acid:cation symporter [Flagellatimonas centrodinii]|uniref:dicarboxylate/amino acid:cation symporter n=1 Tax=Flagellatimonas centrodinii TaxID=2806210 RepID=UPI001FEEEBA6|nr:dicarboxylate/amino acid:cation symporter [Flagellatimonas centrodinii]ULQ46931.1 dicarboxylate/amino acid:cation symporter [Flagellatimonas centrodinii]